MSKDLSWRPGGGKHDIAHRAWRQPDLTLDVDTRKTHCHKCLRPVRHPIHARVFRERKDWFGWKCGELDKANAYDATMSNRDALKKSWYKKAREAKR